MEKPSKKLVAAVIGIAALVALILIATGGSDDASKTALVGNALNVPAEFKVEYLKRVNDPSAKTVADGKSVTVHYTGTLADGTVFDSSRERGVPFLFPKGTNNVIRCWEEGLNGVKVGEQIKLTCPADYAYGNQAVGKIPANSTLYFDIEVFDVEG